MKKYPGVAVIGGYVGLITLVLLILDRFVYHDLLNSSHFIYWDAEHYTWIKEFGYEGFRVAFFPLFPLLWRFTDFEISGVVILNGLIFLTSFYFLVRDIKLTLIETLTFLTIPSFIFCFLPFSESVFFMSSVILLLGLRQGKIPIVCLGLLLATLSRPAFTIFIPALLITVFWSFEKRKALFQMGIYLLVILSGMLLVGIIQYADTGEWFQYFAVQKNWGNSLQLPVLPLKSWAGGFIVRLDGASLFLGTGAGIMLTMILTRSGPFGKKEVQPEVIFSLAYLFIISMSVLFFRGGSLFSLNRFVFATPFIMVAFLYWMRLELAFNVRQLLTIFVLIIAFWLLFGSYVHIQAFLKYFALAAYMFLIYLIKSQTELTRKISSGLLIALNVTFQVILIVRFLNGLWVG